MSISRILSFAALLLLAPAVSQAQQPKLADLEKAVKADSNDPSNHVNVALGYFNAKRWADAEREAKAALVLDPRSAQSHLILAMMPYANNKTLWNEAVSSIGIPNSMTAEMAEADKHYKMAFFLDPLVNTSIISLVSGIRDSTEASATGTSKDSLTGKQSDNATIAKNSAAYIVHGIIACNEGRYDDARAAFALFFSNQQGSSVARIPKAVYWYDGIALAHSKEKEYAAAAAIWGTESNRKDDDTRTLLPTDVARIPLNSNDIDFVTGVLQQKYNNGGLAALATYTRTLAVDPTLYLGHVYTADVYDTQRNYDRSIDERMAALKANPDDPTLHFELGLTYAKAGKFPEAIQHLTTASTLMPRSFTVWYTLGLAKGAANDVAGSKAAYGKAVAVATVAQTKLPTYANAKAKM